LSYKHLRPPESGQRSRGIRIVNDVIAILVVEDDPLVQAMVEDALSDGGFKAAITASGEEAVALLRENKHHRVLVTDINLLGRLDGWEVARSAREMDPAMPVIYMTGTQGEEWASKGVPNSVLLAKPFAPAQLVTAVAGLLNASPPPTEQ
jgi:DNA-binding response OmpR family regulator